MPPLPTGQSHFSLPVDVIPAPTTRASTAMFRAQRSLTGLIHPTHSKEVFIPVTGLFGLSLYLCPASLPGARRTPHLRQTGVLSTLPLSFGSLA